MPISDSSIQLVIVLTVTLVVLITAGMLGLAVFGARYLTWLTQYSAQSEQRLLNIYAHKKQRIDLWNRVGLLLAALLFLSLFLIFVTAKWILILALTMIWTPLVVIYAGLSIVDLQFTWTLLPFMPHRVITGKQAVWRGRVLVALGLALLLSCGGLSLQIWQMS